MIVNEDYRGDHWQIFQADDDDLRVKIYRNSKPYKTLTATKKLTAAQLLDILHIYQLE